MVGSWNNERSHYRCKLKTADRELAATGHPSAIYVREDKILDPLDHWLEQLFAPRYQPRMIDTLYMAGDDPVTAAQPEAMSSRLRTSDDRLSKYRSALEAGADPAIVASWIAEVTAERTRCTIDLERLTGAKRLSRDQIAALIEQFAQLTRLLKDADPADRAELYQQLGLRLAYDNEKRLVMAEARPHQAWSKLSVRGGT